MTCGARAPSNQLAGWGAARHHCGAGLESRINPNNVLRQLRGSIFLFASCVIASNAMTRIQTISCFSVREPGAALSQLAIHFECVQILVFC